MSEREDPPGSSRVSRLRVFLLCVLASILSTALGIWAIPWIYGNVPELRNGSGMREEMEGKGNQERGFVRRLGQGKVYKFPGGEMQWVGFPRDSREKREFGNLGNFPGISVARLRLGEGALRVPHWHSNANVQGFVHQGCAWLGVLSPAASPAVTFNVTAGQLFFVPQGSLHWLQNGCRQDLLLFLFFSSAEEPLTLELHQSFRSLPEDVAFRALKPLGGLQFLRTLQKSQNSQIINIPQNLLWNSTFPQSPHSQVWKFFYDLPASPEFPFPGGVFRWARFRRNATRLRENQRIYSRSLQEHEHSLTLATLRLFGKNLGIPHFHSNAHEVGVVLSGCGQAGFSLPSGDFLFPLSVADVFFFPRSSQHFLLSLCPEDFHLLLAYSTNSQLETLRLTEYFLGVPRHVVAPIFGKNPSEFRENFPNFP